MEYKVFYVYTTNRGTSVDGVCWIKAESKDQARALAFYSRAIDTFEIVRVKRVKS